MKTAKNKKTAMLIKIEELEEKLAALSLRLAHFEKALDEAEDSIEQLFELYYRLTKDGYFALDGEDDYDQ